jgi:hypothetical protein
MILYRTTFIVPDLSAIELTDFMANCDDQLYQNWWEGVHIAFHTKKRLTNNVGNRVVFDEYVGSLRLRFNAVLDVYQPGKAMVWHMRKIIPLPAWISLSLEETADGLHITHALKIGFNNKGRVLDRLIEAFLPKEFEQDLADHARHEFGKLKEYLNNLTNGRKEMTHQRPTGRDAIQ